MTLLAAALLFLLQATPPPARAACREAEYRQFDFWIGEWDVYGPGGALAGTNAITRDFDGCVIREEWRGSRGSNGSSLNIFDPINRKWHQTWVDNSGMLLELQGEFRDGAMRLSGPSVSPAGRQLNRVTWTPKSNGEVRQVWETSSDAGKTWRVTFDGVYRRRVGAGR